MQTTNATPATPAVAKKWFEIKREKKAAALRAKIITAHIEAEKRGAQFYPTVSKKIASEIALVSLPKPGAKFLKEVPEHIFFAFKDQAMAAIDKIRVPKHLKHGDFVKDGRPTVERNFYILPSCLGQEIPAEVTTYEKFCPETGKRTIMVDIIQITGNNFPIMVTKKLHLGAPKTGATNEAMIPGTELCVKFDEIQPRKLLA